MASIKRKGKLRNPDGVVDSTDYVPQLAMPGSHDVIEIKEESWGQIAFGWVRGAIAFILILAIFVAILYSGLSAYLMVYSATGKGNEHSWVVRNTWSKTGGQPPLNSDVVISEDTTTPAQWYGFIAVGWTGISSPSTVKIVSTNYDKLYIANSKVSLVNNKAVRNEDFVGSPAYSYNPKKDSAERNYQLRKQYLVECVSGNCKPNTYYVISKDQIFGEVKK